MKVPFICDECEREKDFEVHPITQKCKCGGTMTIFYQDNFEEIAEITRCNTCVHNSVGDSDFCNYCDNI